MSLEHSGGGFTTDRDLVVRSWDDWMAAATGIPAGAATGRPLAELFPEIETRGLLARLRRVADEGNVEVLSPAFHRYLVPCQPRRPSPWFDRMQQYVALSPLRVGGEVAGVVVAIEDVTARRDEERRLAAQLRTGDEPARVRAAEALSRAPGSAEVLMGAFGDASWRVRQLAVEGVARDPGEAVAGALTQALREQHRDLAVLNSTLSTLARSGADVLPRMLELLNDADADLRTYVALGLGLLGDPRAVPALVGALEDDDSNVRFHAIEALARLRARSAAPAVAAVAATRDFFLAFAALDALAAIGDPAVAPLLLPLVDDELLAPAAVHALAELGGEEVVVPLARRVEAPDAPAGELAAALAALAARFQEESGGGELVARLARREISGAGARRLLDALPRAEGEQRVGIVRVLGWLRADGVEQALVGALDDPHTRPAAVEGLVRRGARSVPVLIGRLSELDGEARRGAVAALGRLGSPEAVPALVGLLQSDPEMLALTAGALGGIGDARALPALLELLDHPQAAVRQAAVGALSSIGHAGLAPAVRARMDDPSPRVRESAARIAGYFGYPEAAARLLELCADPADEVRRAAVEHVVYAVEEGAAQAVEAVLGDPVAAVRAAAARAAAQLAPGDAAPLLRRALADPDLWVRYYAARAIGSVGLPDAGDLLSAAATSDAAVPVRIAAAQALAGLEHGPPGTLVALARDEIPDVAQAALRRLGGTEGDDAVAALRAALASGDPVRQEAALAGLDGAALAALEEPVEELARTAGEPGVREAAVRALLAGGSERAMSVVCALAGDPSRRDGCLRALAAVPGALLPALASVLRDCPEELRLVAVDALSRRGDDDDAYRLLAWALDDEFPAVRGAAAYALARADLRAALAGEAGAERGPASGRP